MKIGFVTVVLLTVAGSLAGFWGCRQHTSEVIPPYSVLSGKWQRPDGGYILEIKNVAESGAMEAAYFNPRPIHVAKAQASQGDGRLRVLVELRDVNYPGSTYDVVYDPAGDRLTGTYDQAVEKQTFEVFFTRLKP